ncbi:tRNA (5-methylaminomethyl-2-thiouridine)(34)-methyltransferase MnmD [Francisella philomiragia]|uniref:tRNA (5-methylaminomethyl-2-thiouridine)(34)-methyltransferase MnmD n=1 Tax=Francisella philomiragia TaxID=28110 RepID=UPI001C9DA10D|nr:tRNA (5-methylaminomethyl-2-thiouridine)(34)-methyltransferase MnmD [Francisella philomiragia]MBY7735329.1 tRNA (5-methylaminomethyl-2-thiouridine)(34)-methyltransferase MnmD [Francisella philomiragia]
MYTKIIWQDNTPKSELFDDFYFSSTSGINESSYNYLEHNFLEQRFKKLADYQIYRICETGFGSGLNFILTMNLWESLAPKNAKLEFVSFEKYPISPSDLKEIFIALNGIAGHEKLLSAYDPKPGLNIYKFNNVILKLIIDDARYISNYDLDVVDTWFLDGFSPAKNTSIWEETFFANMMKLSKNQSNFATFTSASKIRKLLQKYGFKVNKDTGFGKKREMMYGTFIN